MATIAYYLNSYREITWREFISSFLFQDRVERLEVVNKKWVRVILNQRNSQEVT